MSRMIDNGAIEYNQVEEDVNNQVLVTNILRARDGAPLYLAEFQDIHVTLTNSVTASSPIPFGPGKIVNKEYGVTVSAQLQSQPSFDAVQLDTQQFTLGMLQPISPTTWEYYWHRDYSREILLRLFVASISDGTESLSNNPCPSGLIDADCTYEAFSNKVDSLTQGGVFLNIFSVLTPSAMDPESKAATTAASAPASPTTLRVYSLDAKRYVFDQSSPQVEICTLPKLDSDTAVTEWGRVTQYAINPCPGLDISSSSSSGAAPQHPSPAPASSPPAPAPAGAVGVAATPAPASSALGATPLTEGSSLSSHEMELFICTHRQVIICRPSWSSVQVSTIEGHGYVLRSVDAILHYLGEVQRLVDTEPGADDTPKGVTWQEHGVTQTLFQLRQRASSADRIAVSYHGRRYYVRQGDPSDHTLEVLALVNQLINANKVATEIPSTKAVQIVP